MKDGVPLENEQTGYNGAIGAKIRLLHQSRNRT
jgi:hypothetical protein